MCDTTCVLFIVLPTPECVSCRAVMQLQCDWPLRSCPLTFNTHTLSSPSFGRVHVPKERVTNTLNDGGIDVGGDGWGWRCVCFRSKQTHTSFGVNVFCVNIFVCVCVCQPTATHSGLFRLLWGPCVSKYKIH